MNTYTNLARQSINYFLEKQKMMDLPLGLPEKLLKTKSATFVTLHQKPSGELRGCVGTFIPIRENVAEEIIYNAVSSAVDDPRFPPVTLADLPAIEISVDVLSSLKHISAKLLNSLNPKKDGLLVRTSDDRRGILLPDIEGIETIDEQERICRLKAGIGRNEPVSYQTFTVDRFHE